MLFRLAALAAITCGALSAAPIQITINLSGGTFDRGKTTANTDTGLNILTASTTCSGAGCANLAAMGGLDGLVFNFAVTSDSSTGAGSVLSGTLTNSSKVNGLAFVGQSSFSATSPFVENVTASGVLGTLTALTGTMTLNWSGNATTQAKTVSSGTLVLNGNVAGVPEPSTALLLGAPMLAALLLRKRKAARVQ